MNNNESIKKRLDTVFKETSVWKQEEIDFTKVKQVTGKKIKIVDLSDYIKKMNH